MKLSELIIKMRTDRPDEWLMDEFASKARHLEDKLDKSEKNYIKTCKGRMDFRNSFREGRKQIVKLQADRSELEYKCMDRLHENEKLQAEIAALKSDKAKFSRVCLGALKVRKQGFNI